MARPSFKPTPMQRREVETLARLGLPHDQISEYVNLRSIKSLKKHFSKELQRGLSQAIAHVSRVCFEMAKSQKYPAVTTFWINTIGSAQLATVEGDSVFKMRFYREEPPPPDEEDEFVRTKDGLYLHERVIGPLPKKPRVTARATLKNGGENNAQPEM